MEPFIIGSVAIFGLLFGYFIAHKIDLLTQAAWGKKMEHKADTAFYVVIGTLLALLSIWQWYLST